MSTPSMFSVESSNIAAFGYDQGSQTLVTQFTNGTRYSYEAVPLEVFGQLLAAESKGSAFHELIKKGGFNFQKLEVPNG